MFSNFAGSTPRQIAREFAAVRKLKPNIQKAVGHLILSPDPDDRQLTTEEWTKALSIALAAHGASDAPCVAYLHDDTEIRHLHVFFSRITHMGEVISDSHSYQKNRSAAKQITKELNLTPLPTTPKSDAPGDRQALENATRSAERQGFQPVSAAEVRSAIDAAKTFDDINVQLAKNQVQAKFATRGPDKKIYGWMVRRVGSEEWVKASTLAKGLSWPKIAHRFADSDSAKQIPAEQVAVFAEPVPATTQNQRADLHRIPMQLRPILQSTHGANQMSLLAAKIDERLGGMSARVDGMFNVSDSPLVLTSLVLGKLLLEAARFSAKALAALVAFIRHILTFFGIGLRQAAVVQKTEQKVMPALTYEPFMLPDEDQLHGMQDVDKKAAGILQDTLDALQSGNLNSLPMGPKGRAELIQALQDEEIGSNEGGASSQGQALKELAPAEALGLAMSTFLECCDKLVASQKVNNVVAARKALYQAQTALKKVEVEHAALLTKTNRLLRPLVPSLKSSSEFELSAVLKAEANLENAINELPASAVSVPQPEIGAASDAFSKAWRDLEIKGVDVHRQMQADIETLTDGFDKSARLKASSFEAQLKIFKTSPYTSVAGELMKFAKGFESALSVARAAEAQHEKEISELALRESERQGHEQNDTPQSDRQAPK